MLQGRRRWLEALAPAGVDSIITRIVDDPAANAAKAAHEGTLPVPVANRLIQNSIA